MLTLFIILGVVLLFVIPSTLVYFLQHKIIFAPKHYNRRRLFAEYPELYRPLELEVEKGVYLEGIVYEPEIQATTTMLFFGGREQDSVTLIAKFSLHFPKTRIIAFNYRAYGTSGGEASEAAFHGDALKIYDYVEKRFERPVLLGYSLGSNVATFVGARRNPKELILVATFTSVQALSKSKGRPIPRFFIKHRFETIHEIIKIEKPFYMFATRDDDFVPIAQPRQLKEKMGDLVDYKEFDGYNHAQLLFSDEVCEEIQKVLQK